MSTATPWQEMDRLSLRDVTQLVEARAWPAVSILLDTTPAPVMRPQDVRRLERLVEEVEDELRSRGVLSSEPVMSRVRALVTEAAAGPTGRGLALFASRALERSMRLPAPVGPRAAVDRRFLTRDLVRALHRMPPHLVLVLHAGCAHLYHGYADTLVPLADSGFPIEHAQPVVGRLEAGDDGLEDFLTRVDSAFGRARTEHPSPMVLAGSRKVVTAFVHRSRHLYRLVGVITGPATETISDLYGATSAAVEEYLLSREAEALWTLEHARASRPEDVATGLGECQASVRRGQPALLAVEEGFGAAAEGAKVTADAVDDLVETVIERGGWVALTHDGALAEHGRIAMVLRPRQGPGPGT